MGLFKERTLNLGKDIYHAGDITMETARFFDLKTLDLLSRRRTVAISYARHVAWYLIRERTLLSYPQIADLFDRDPSSVMYGVNRIQKLRTEAILLIGHFYPTELIGNVLGPVQS